MRAITVMHGDWAPRKFVPAPTTMANLHQQQGNPILGQLQSYDVTNILVVVVRYFGGTLLGVSGLINAYRAATIEALNNADILSKLIEIQYELKFEYAMLNTVMNKLKQENYDIVTTDFQESCRLIFKARKSEDDSAFQLFNEIYGIGIKRLA